MASVEGSPSAKRAASSSVSTEEEEAEEKPLCIIAVLNLSGPGFWYDWYAFDISNDPKHNQAPPPPLILPPGFSRYYRKFPDHLLPFHEDDDHASINLRSVATRSSHKHAGWAVLGPTTTTNQPGTLYHILGPGNPTLVEDPGACVERIELIQGVGGGLCGEWMSVAKTPSPVRNPGCHFLLGKLYCLGDFTFGGGKVGPWPWAMAYDPSLDKWEPLPEPFCRPRDRPTFTAAIDGGQLGPAIVVASEGLLQIYDVNARSWGLEPFDCDHVLPGPASNRGAQAVAVENMLYWYVVSHQCLVGYDLVTRNLFRGHLPMHDHGSYIRLDAEYPPSLVHLGRDGIDNKFCLSWVSELPQQAVISRLHCLKVCVFITDEILSETGIFHLDISIITCQSYLVHGLKGFRGAMVVNGNLEDKTLPQLMTRPKKKQRIRERVQLGLNGNVIEN